MNKYPHKPKYIQCLSQEHYLSRVCMVLLLDLELNHYFCTTVLQADEKLRVDKQHPSKHTERYLASWLILIPTLWRMVSTKEKKYHVMGWLNQWKNDTPRV